MDEHPAVLETRRGLLVLRFDPRDGGVEYPLLVPVLMAAIAIRGGGRCAIDRLLGREL